MTIECLGRLRASFFASTCGTSSGSEEFASCNFSCVSPEHVQDKVEGATTRVLIECFFGQLYKFKDYFGSPIAIEKSSVLLRLYCVELAPYSIAPVELLNEED